MSVRRSGGRPRRGRGGGRKRTERPAKTAADLDAEMEVSGLVPSLDSCLILILQSRSILLAPPLLLLRNGFLISSCRCNSSCLVLLRFVFVCLETVWTLIVVYLSPSQIHTFTQYPVPARASQVLSRMLCPTLGAYTARIELTP